MGNNGPVGTEAQAASSLTASYRVMSRGTKGRALRLPSMTLPPVGRSHARNSRLKTASKRLVFGTLVSYRETCQDSRAVERAISSTPSHAEIARQSWRISWWLIEALDSGCFEVKGPVRAIYERPLCFVLREKPQDEAVGDGVLGAFISSRPSFPP